ncbi:hypothetical protein RR46_09033 [Papilio xuthus]|uniref:Uncharacterized protein n=1 Tax=Papilio xuthus TaxID=66420 RepID=A0A194PUP2_PAPXU|nr:hypothetical protein RR46_09033 [Papilio xuthus]
MLMDQFHKRIPMVNFRKKKITVNTKVTDLINVWCRSVRRQRRPARAPATTPARRPASSDHLKPHQHHKTHTEIEQNWTKCGAVPTVQAVSFESFLALRKFCDATVALSEDRRAERARDYD